jgi:dihydrofolate synthase/folylpolyglutamate synthase
MGVRVDALCNGYKMHSEFPATLEAWLERIEACHPSEIELGLDRIRTVAERLSIELGAGKRVLIAGTNGKGSTATMLESIARSAGLSTGLYTSPHFLRYNERIRLNGDEVSDAVLCAQFERIERARGDIALTYFEYGTLAALLCFAQAQPDLLLLEVGLGGRLDAVNIVDCDLAIVTTVALDHTDWLGDDREQIGREKAGIMRAGKPALCGDAEPPQSLLEHARALHAPLLVRERDYRAVQRDSGWDWQGVDANGQPLSHTELPLPSLPLVNAATVLQALALLELNIPRQALVAGLQHARMTGRMQQIALAEGPCILDVAHNPEAAAYIARWLERAPVAGRTHLVVGMLSDKDIAQVIRQLQPQIEHWYPATLGGPRGTTAAALAERIEACGGAVVARYDSVRSALAAARAAMTPGDRILVAGSFLTVAAALETLEQER